MRSQESPLASIPGLEAAPGRLPSPIHDSTKRALPQSLQPARTNLLFRGSGFTGLTSEETLSSEISVRPVPHNSTEGPYNEVATGAPSFERAKTKAPLHTEPKNITNDGEVVKLRANAPTLDESQRADDAHRANGLEALPSASDAPSRGQTLKCTSGQQSLLNGSQSTRSGISQPSPDLLISTPTSPLVEDRERQATQTPPPTTAFSSAESSTHRMHESEGSSTSYHTAETSSSVSESSSPRCAYPGSGTFSSAASPLVPSDVTASFGVETTTSSSPEPGPAQAPSTSQSAYTTTSQSTSHPTMNSPPTPTRFPGRRQGAPTHFPSFPSKAFTTSINSPSLRLSPAIISRHKPMPLLNLPIILPRPSVTPGPEGPSTRTGRSRLRSLPALPIQGRDVSRDSDDDLELEQDIDEADEGEDDEDVDSSPDEPDDQDAASPSRRMTLPTIDTTALSMPDFARPFFFQKGKQRESSFASETSTTTRSSVYFTPTSPQQINEHTETDYFTSRSFAPSVSSRTPRDPDPLRTPLAQPSTQPSAAGPSFARVSPNSSPRPIMHKQASRSMINLTSVVVPHDKPTSISEDDVPLQHVADRNIAAVQSTDPSADGQDKTKNLGPAPPYRPLRNRRSMPTFNPNTQPPPYPADLPPFRHPHSEPSRIFVREDEGSEELPCYSNDIYLTAIMPRKMEFIEPGVQAKDRKWRRVLCVLEGTAFKVYKCPAGATGSNPLSEWWERRVGVPDTTDPTAPKSLSDLRRLRAGPERPMKWEEEEDATRSRPDRGPSTHEVPIPKPTPSSQPYAQSQGPASRSKLSVTNLLKPGRRHHRSHSSDPRASSTSSSVTPSPRTSLSTSRPSLNGDSSNSSTTAIGAAPPRSSVSSSRSSFSSLTRPRASSATNRLERMESPSTARTLESHIMQPKPEDLISAYTLQGAESGLGNDYLKRKNVIRARMEGEQFLLQAPDIGAVIEWIEGIHAGTNVSLDLDQRPMPRGPLFPRRRRRRARPPTAGTDSAQNNSRGADDRAR